MYEILITALWIVLPAYVSNSTAVLGGGGPPIDGGRTYKGKRILGDGKTWRGLLTGVSAGTLIGLALNILNPSVSIFLGAALPTFSMGTLLGLAFGTMAGDMAASIVKRRLGKNRGSAFPIVDQLDFLVGGLFFGLLFDPRWFSANLSPEIIATLVVLTPAVHLTANIIAYNTGLKNEPW